MMRAVQGLQRLFCRGLSLKAPPGGSSTRGSIPNTEAYKKIQDLQSTLLRDDGLLVWQKRGARDRIPYLVSILACVVGGSSCVYNLVVMAFPQKTD